MAHSRPEGGRGNLALRLGSACVLAPPVIFAVYAGFPWYEGVVAIVVALMVWEWTRVCGARAAMVSGLILAAAVLGSCLAISAAMPQVAAATAAAAAVILAGVQLRRGISEAVIFSCGGLAIISCAAALLWLRTGAEAGRELVFGLLCAVWCTDTGAYFVGRTVGGPRLAPRISPAKTWAGLCGGIVGAAACGWIWARLAGFGSQGWAMACGAMIALLAQAGDLAMSAVKRRYGVKDSSGLIPGHGGVLDRVDGMLLTAPAVVLAVVTLDGA